MLHDWHVRSSAMLGPSPPRLRDTKWHPFARCFDLPFKERVAEAVSLVGMQEDKVRLRDDEVKEGTACAAARLALAPLT